MQRTGQLPDGFHLAMMDSEAESDQSLSVSDRSDSSSEQPPLQFEQPPLPLKRPHPPPASPPQSRLPVIKLKISGRQSSAAADSAPFQSSQRSPEQCKEPPESERSTEIVNEDRISQMKIEIAPAPDAQQDAHPSGESDVEISSSDSGTDCEEEAPKRVRTTVRRPAKRCAFCLGILSFGNEMEHLCSSVVFVGATLLLR